MNSKYGCALVKRKTWKGWEKVNLYHLYMMQMAQTGALENHFYMLALMFKSTLQKPNDKFSLLEIESCSSHAAACFPLKRASMFGFVFICTFSNEALGCAVLTTKPFTWTAPDLEFVPIYFYLFPSHVLGYVAFCTF